MAVLGAIWWFITLVWGMLVDWLYIFVSPIENLHVLWILVPIWLCWFFSEFFQEKRGTSLGNAITNGAIPLWVGIDWIRYLTNLLVDGKIIFNYIVVIKYFICLAVFIYGAVIIYHGIKAKTFIHYIGRIREVTYVLVVFTPIIYGIFVLDLRYIITIIIFYPIFHYVIEYIDQKFPDPVAFVKDKIEGM